MYSVSGLLLELGQVETIGKSALFLAMIMDATFHMLENVIMHNFHPDLKQT